MKVLLSILFFSIFLSIGGNAICATTSSVAKGFSQNFSQKEPSGVPTETQVYTLIDDSELDVEMESPICNDVVNQKNTAFYTNTSSFFALQYGENSIRLTTNKYSKRFKNQPPFNGYSTPNYFTQRILRI